MNKAQGTDKFPYGIYFLRGVGIFAIFMAIKSLMTLYCLMISQPSTGKGDVFSSIPVFAIFIIVAVGSLFVYNSLVNFLTLYDRRVMKAFLSKKKHKITFSEEMREVITSREFLVETGTVLLLSLLVATVGGFGEYAQIFSVTGASTALLRALPFIAIIIYIPTISAFARYEVRRRWHYLEHTDRLNTLYSILRIIGKAAIILFGYILIFPYSPIILFAYLSIFGIFGEFFDFYFIVISLTVITVITAIILCIRALRAVSQRKKLIKKLTHFAKVTGYELSPITHPYASLFKPLRECNFTLKYEDKLFSCRLIGAWWHRAPLYFVSDKHAHYRHRFGTNAHHIDFLGEFCYDFEGDGQKILILNPVPKNAFVTKVNTPYIEHSWYDEDIKMATLRGSGKMRPGRLSTTGNDNVKKVEPGDKIWGYVIYNTTSFIGAIDRKCLGRTKGMFE